MQNASHFIEVDGINYNYNIVAAPDLKALFSIYIRPPLLFKKLYFQDLYWYAYRILNPISHDSVWLGTFLKRVDTAEFRSHFPPIKLHAKFTLKYTSLIRPLEVNQLDPISQMEPDSQSTLQVHGKDSIGKRMPLPLEGVISKKSKLNEPTTKYSSWKVVQLRDECKRRQITSTGIKKILVESIETQFASLPVSHPVTEWETYDSEVIADVASKFSETDQAAINWMELPKPSGCPFEISIILIINLNSHRASKRYLSVLLLHYQFGKVQFV